MLIGHIWANPETIHEMAKRLSRESRLKNKNIKKTRQGIPRKRSNEKNGKIKEMKQ